ncbi:MAG: hypothetical protein AVDCRST_MAG01-01-1188, partial [uncultured Rubrobacteraceae bacterium]
GRAKDAEVRIQGGGESGWSGPSGGRGPGGRTLRHRGERGLPRHPPSQGVRPGAGGPPGGSRGFRRAVGR